VACSDEGVEAVQQGGDVVEVEAGGRFVKDVKDLLAFGIAEVGRQLDALASPPERVVAGWPSLR